MNLWLIGISLAAVITCPLATASLPTRSSYYPKAFLTSPAREEGLKAELHDILTSVHVLTDDHDELSERCPEGKTCRSFARTSYLQARQILWGTLHASTNRGQRQVRDVYCDQWIDLKGDGNLPDPQEGNTEHTWPQSKFSRQFSKETQKTDLHILFPVLSRANTLRSNHEFGDVTTITSQVCPASSLGYTQRGHRSPRFEPPSSHKGNVARALFYFAIRYRMKIDEEQETSLRSWHRMDPVDEAELARNESIFGRQNDRNPFVDYPELSDLISDF